MPHKTRLSVWEEHRFWLGILYDHATFVWQDLAPSEVPLIRQAEEFRQAFAAIIQRVDQIPHDLPVNSDPMIQLAAEAQTLAHSYYEFEGHIQHLRIDNAIVISLTPSFFNGTLIENEEYLRLLSFWTQGLEAEELSLYGLLDMWLEDQLGHAVLLWDHLDPVEVELSETGRRFSNTFQSYMVKNRAMGGYLRFTPPGFPAQRRFASDVAAATASFYEFVVRIINLYENQELLSRLTLRFLDHHLPESCYFLYKLSAFEPNILIPKSCFLFKPLAPSEDLTYPLVPTQPRTD
ncbi:DUF2935 domain-containing protein [Paenibacillus sp. FJAT-26967]|uniref:DUF2935 domain-containing protein n=1 Tax=Paenibacillus sp. FJAT-26967 TaxID=1729690 RepID=UPI0008397043|nr:DUF2935 domain-containing protein [Paenibacillus sp. FJAT-26967]